MELFCDCGEKFHLCKHCNVQKLQSEFGVAFGRRMKTCLSCRIRVNGKKPKHYTEKKKGECCSCVDYCCKELHYCSKCHRQKGAQEFGKLGTSTRRYKLCESCRKIPRCAFCGLIGTELCRGCWVLISRWGDRDGRWSVDITEAAIAEIRKAVEWKEQPNPPIHYTPQVIQCIRGLVGDNRVHDVVSQLERDDKNWNFDHNDLFSHQGPDRMYENESSQSSRLFFVPHIFHELRDTKFTTLKEIVEKIKRIYDRWIPIKFNDIKFCTGFINLMEWVEKNTPKDH